jgi:16S rRNA (guanine(966)-N(2))-methyltransferase RsmD
MKIAAGSLKNRSLMIPKKSSLRPTSAKVRSQVFDICQHHVEDASFLDLCAGTGAMGIEAISRGAKRSTFVEKNSSTASLLRTNIQKLGIEKQCSLLSMDAVQALSLLARKGDPFSLVYIDPPYGQQELLTDLINAVDTLLPLEKGARVVVEARKGALLPTSLSRLSLLSHRTSGDTDLFIIVHKDVILKSL